MTNSFSLKASKLFLYSASFAVLIVSRSTLFPFIVGKYVFFRVAVELALICFIWAWARGEIKISNLSAKGGSASGGKSCPYGTSPEGKQISNLFKQPLVIAVSVFTFIFLLAGFLGYNPSSSFWSNFERGEGGLQILHLSVFFILLVLLFRDEKSWRKMLWVFLLAAGLMIAYGLGAASGIKFLIGPNLCARFAGSLGNPAYVGTYMIFALFFTAYLFMETRINTDKKRIYTDKKSVSIRQNPYKSASFKKWLLIILLVLFFVILLFSQTRGAFLGLIAGFVAGLLYLFFCLPKGRTRKIVLIMIVVFAIFGGTAFRFRRSMDIMPFCHNQGGGNRILDINLGTETFQTRLLLWKQALVLTKERPILGWGPENFSPAFEKHYLPQFTVWYDRAHNIFLDYLSQTGILGLLSYLSIWVVFYWQFFKTTRINADKKPINADKKISINQQNPYKSAAQNALFFALPVAYLVQGIVLFEVLPIYICLFLFLAFAVYKFQIPSIK